MRKCGGLALRLSVGVVVSTSEEVVGGTHDDRDGILVEYVVDIDLCYEW